jgi:hypothetical protein
MTRQLPDLLQRENRLTFCGAFDGVSLVITMSSEF